MRHQPLVARFAHAWRQAAVRVDVSAFTNRFNVSLVSLREGPSDDTLEKFGIDVTYLHTGSSIPATRRPAQGDRPAGARGPALQGHGATTFGRLPRRAGHRCDPPRACQPDERRGSRRWPLALPLHTGVGIAGSASTAEFNGRGTSHPARATKVVYLGAPVDSSAGPRLPGHRGRARGPWIARGTSAIGTVTRLMPSKGNRYLIQAMRPVVEQVPVPTSTSPAKASRNGELVMLGAARSGSREFLGFHRCGERGCRLRCGGVPRRKDHEIERRERLGDIAPEAEELDPIADAASRRGTPRARPAARLRRRCSTRALREALDDGASPESGTRCPSTASAASRCRPRSVPGGMPSAAARRGHLARAIAAGRTRRADARDTPPWCAPPASAAPGW